jgi:hypothetical protein
LVARVVDRPGAADHALLGVEADGLALLGRAGPSAKP